MLLHLKATCHINMYKFIIMPEKKSGVRRKMLKLALDTSRQSKIYNSSDIRTF